MELARRIIQENGFDAMALREYRKTRRESQSRFWSRFGVTQSRGSRFEMGKVIPPPVAILLKLYLKGAITDDDW
jgi:transcriptional regulator with XRE-family HTH domain